MGRNLNTLSVEDVLLKTVKASLGIPEPEAISILPAEVYRNQDIPDLINCADKASAPIGGINPFTESGKTLNESV